MPKPEIVKPEIVEEIKRNLQHLYQQELLKDIPETTAEIRAIVRELFRRIPAFLSKTLKYDVAFFAEEALSDELHTVVSFEFGVPPYTRFDYPEATGSNRRFLENIKLTLRMGEKAAFEETGVMDLQYSEHPIENLVFLYTIKDKDEQDLVITQLSDNFSMELLLICMRLEDHDEIVKEDFKDEYHILIKEYMRTPNYGAQFSYNIVQGITEPSQEELTNFIEEFFIFLSEKDFFKPGVTVSQLKEVARTNDRITRMEAELRYFIDNHELYEHRKLIKESYTGNSIEELLPQIIGEFIKLSYEEAGSSISSVSGENLYDQISQLVEFAKQNSDPQAFLSHLEQTINDVFAPLEESGNITADEIEAAEFMLGAVFEVQEFLNSPSEDISSNPIAEELYKVIIAIKHGGNLEKFMIDLARIRIQSWLEYILQMYIEKLMQIALEEERYENARHWIIKYNGRERAYIPDVMAKMITNQYLNSKPDMIFKMVTDFDFDLTAEDLVTDFVNYISVQEYMRRELFESVPDLKQKIIKQTLRNKQIQETLDEIEEQNYITRLQRLATENKQINEELTRSDKSDIKDLIAKELDKVLKKEIEKILKDELSKSLSSKETKEEIGDITKKVMKKLYKDLSYHHPYIIDRIKV